MKIIKENSICLENFNAGLVLQDGNYFLGSGVGHPGVTSGELCFNTSMTGYQEAMTDPSYAGQIVTFTFPHIGNVGINGIDNESNSPLIQGVIFRSSVSLPSNYRSETSLNDWLRQKKITGICEVDTRSIVKIIRSFNSPLRAAIGFWDDGLSEEKLNLLKESALHDKGLIGRDFANVINKQVYNWKEPSWHTSATELKDPYNIVVLDFGVKQSILRKICDLGCSVTVLPADSSLRKILDYCPDGIILSNGPGDPRQTYLQIRDTLSSLISLELPIFGICLGHQMMALALGGEIEKMPCGHHGINHPVQDLRTNKIYITSQNHEFMVSFKSKISAIEITHVSLFDGTIEGFSVPHKPILCTQFHPESSPGPKDSEHFFGEFLEIIKKNKMTHSVNQIQEKAHA
jgi:carbamoyl-phosphate synthase small subunit